VRKERKSFHAIIRTRQDPAIIPPVPMANLGREPTFALIKFVPMAQRILFRWILPAIAGLLLGFLALAWSITRESTAPAFLIVLFSPGLKIAEFIMPAAHESLAWTFGWFLRIAIGVNAVVYFSILALAAYFLDRRARGA
jgi:hypothetical protein